MDAVLVEFAADGRVRLDGGEWMRPTVQERRAIIHAAEEQAESLKELLEALDATA